MRAVAADGDNLSLCGMCLCLRLRVCQLTVAAAATWIVKHSDTLCPDALAFGVVKTMLSRVQQ